jgi:biopolymer transport protein ExbD
MKLRRLSRHPAVPSSVNLTAVLDVMTILLVFLLKTLDVDATPIAGVETLRLPSAVGGRPPEVAVHIALSAGELRVDGLPVLRWVDVVDPILQEPTVALPPEAVSHHIILPLAEVLRTKAARAAALTPAGAFEGRVILAADRELPWSVLRDVVASAASAGFVHLELLVAPG